jgi:hypothetical protein
VTNDDGLPNIAILFELVDEKLRDLEARDSAQRRFTNVCEYAQRAR